MDQEFITYDDIIDALKISRSKSEAAALLDRTPRWLYNKLEQYNIDPRKFEDKNKGAINHNYKSYTTELPTILKEKCNLRINRHILVRTLINDNLIDGECEKCGMCERGNVDVEWPFIICSVNGDDKDLRLKNIYLLCYTCAFVEFGYAKLTPYLRYKTGKGRPKLTTNPDLLKRRRKKD